MFDVLRKKLDEFKHSLKQTINQKKNSEQPNDTQTKTDSAFTREIKTKIGLKKKVQAVLSQTIELSENELNTALEQLEWALLEADVEQATAIELVNQIKNRLIGKKISTSQNPDELVRNEIRDALTKILDLPRIDLLELGRQKKPFVILVLGPNGAGKTTSIAKLARFFQKNNQKTLFAASDTFRAASIEQLEKHASKLNNRVIKHQYGSDPAAVAFDAIASAKSHQIDVVLIDSAGRQETNKNLLEELKKLVRVAKPDLKIFVAESFSGQALLTQAREFDSTLGLDGFILTKMDVDPKGGTLLSLAFNLHKPILFLGTGQEYDDLQAFDAKTIVQKII